MALVGLMQTLALEGQKHGIRVNCLAPVGDEAPTRMILLSGAGSFECAHVTMTHGVFVGHAENQAAEVHARLDEIRARDGETVPGTAWEQYKLELAKAGFATELATAE